MPALVTTARRAILLGAVRCGLAATAMTIPAALAAPATLAASAAPPIPARPATPAPPAGKATPAAPTPSLAQVYHHQAWGPAQGAPAQIQTIVQSPDGYLWLACDYGVYRFDGVNFDRADTIGGQPLRSQHAVSLLAEADGGLWVGYRSGGVSHYQAGKASHYGHERGFPDAVALQLLRGPDGRLWATTHRAIGSLEHGRWQMVGAEQGLGPETGETRRMLFARDGTQWVVTTAGAYYRAPGAARFTQAWPRGVELTSVLELADGSILAGGLEHVYRLSRQPVPATPLMSAMGVWSDRAGALWLSHRTSLEWLPPGAVSGAARQLGTAQGLSGREPSAFLEDRDGNIWIATNNGLDRLRRWRSPTVPAAMRIVSSAMAAGRDGTVWISEDRVGASRFDHQGRLWQQVPYSFATGVTAADGSVTLGSRAGIWIEGADGGTLVPAWPEALRRDADVSSFGRDDSGVWWANYRGLALMRLVDGRWRQADGVLPGLPPMRPRTIAADPQGHLWLGYADNLVARHAHGKSTVFGAAQGLRLGDTTALYARRGRLWAGGAGGLARFDGQRFHMLATADGRVLRSISGIVETASGELWLRGQDGLFRIPAADVAAFVRDGRPVRYELFDGGDGIGAPISPVGPYPSLVEASNGRLWIASNDGASTLDPGAIPRNPRAPAVEIRSVASDGKSYAPSSGLRLPEGSSSLQIGFSALNLTRPERTTFRYRLQGVDSGWQQTTSRREAFYTNLAPGSYRFQVSAANEDGVWNEPGATLELTIPPTFMQSWAFKALCGLAALALAALAWRWRLRHLTALLEARHVERLNERQRIARALHDTFLQEAQGTLLMMNLAMEQVPSGQPARRAIERAIDHMEEALAEGRDEVMGLRSAIGSDISLGAALERFGRRMANNLPTRFSLRTEGQPYPLRPLVADEVFAIAREAIVNAFRHAGASVIEVELRYDAAEFLVRVSDDGRGLPAQPGSDAAPSGHYGLVGMRERAARIEARLALHAGDTGGTVVRISLAAERARAA
ncbi:two-component regulator propeller domain-containing protein [Oxalobacteraceae bacterium A2-2]